MTNGQLLNSTAYFVDTGSRADKAKSNLLNNAKVQHLKPYIGTVLENIQISQLSKEGLNELALLVAERKLVVLRNQDFKDIRLVRQIEIASHFGRLHKHPTGGHVKEHHELLRNFFKEYLGNNRLSRIGWHSDISYEKQTPSATFFWILDQPEVGGNTLFVSLVETYNRLSPQFQKRLEAEFSRARGASVRREPVETEHLIVRVHPVTGEKALFINENFTQHIAGLKDEESKALLGFLYDHIAKGANFQARAVYKPGTLILWDNRIVLHSGVPDFDSNIRRHAVRLSPQGEVPIPATTA
ncbi:hypothetical protein M422DRAFT_59441 [Sphaerobolus stellatus SS14]|nr:hypothetical protein M422DRAFT_59441 [Sphaerobolus stellatus SS14]